LLLGGIGVAVGVPVAFALTRLLQSQLYGIGPHDPLTIGAAVAALLAVAAGAAWVPARRAAKTDPLVALRAE
jgi:ABC-type antimicrobial peptide transport system permease subunit